MSLEGLPPELIGIILGYLPDAQSLLSAILTCSRLHNVYRVSPAELATQVSFNCVTQDIMPEAWMNFRLQTSKNTEFLVMAAKEELKERKQPSEAFNLPVSLELCRTHLLINGFTDILAAHAFALPLAEVTGPQSSMVAPPTQTEIQRIQRAFYRFEMSGHLYRAFGDEVSEGCMWPLFFSRFAPWENEQLACIYDHLYRIITPAFNELADHDIQWGELRIRHAYSYDSHDIRGIMSRGLSYMKTLSAADTFEQRQAILQPGLNASVWVFLYDGLRCANPSAVIDQLEEWSCEEYQEFLSHQRPFFAEADTGPEAAWKWGALSESYYDFVLAERQRPLREQGYVFYDQARLDQSFAYHHKWSGSLTDIKVHRDVLKQEQRGMDRRARIYWSGGRGWWSPSDESKVIYRPKLSSPSSKNGAKISSWSAETQLIRN